MVFASDTITRAIQEERSVSVIQGQGGRRRNICPSGVYDGLIGNRLPEEGPWAPGYYSTLFEDPDGIRIEANFVPGKGNLRERS